MSSTDHSQGRRVGIRALLLLTIMIAIPAGLQSGFAHEAPVQQTAALRISKPVAPFVCSPVDFSITDYPIGNGTIRIAVGDFNSDGKQDLVTANDTSNSVSVLLGNGDGTFLSATYYPAISRSISVAVADLFGDRNDDLVVASFDTNDVAYLQGAGDGTFFPPYNFPMGATSDKVVIGDLNNDAFPDIVTVSSSASNVSIRLNDGMGDFAPATHIAVTGVPYSLAIGDLSGDGKQDLVTANYDGDNVSVLLGNGNGTFQSPTNFAAGDGAYAVAIGDLNSDGKPDLATANRASNNVAILLGNGNGTFQSPISFIVDTGPIDVAVGDFNSDGNPDVVTANVDASNVSVLVGNGDGSFQFAISFYVGLWPFSVAVGDFNSDGKPDLATANVQSQGVSVLLNTCAGLPNTPTPIPVPTNIPVPSQTPGGPTATPQACAIQFADVTSDNTFYPFVRCLACRGIISGYACGGQGEPCNPANDPYFRPSNPVTRGQLAKIVSNSAGFSDPVSGQTFEDVAPGSAFYTFVERLVVREVMGGYNCGGAGEPCGNGNLPYFRPGSGATRGQLTKIVANAAGFTNPAPGTFTFTDVPVGSTFHIYVERLLMNRPGVMGGYDCGGVGEPCDTLNRAYFRPANPLTRGQTSKIVGNTFYPNCQTPARAGNK